MSLFTRLALPARFPARRAFSQTACARVLKEGNLGHEGRHEEIDKHTRDNLEKQKEGKGQWKDELASESESAVKADRGEIDASEDTIRKLQEETEKIAKQK